MNRIVKILMRCFTVMFICGLCGLVHAQTDGNTGVKTRSTLYPASLAETARRNAAEYGWAKDIVSNTVVAAEFYKNMSDDDLWDMVIDPKAGFRSLMVWSNGHCPSCGNPVAMYAWTVEPKTEPWKVRCPKCKDFFPKNDFEAFKNSGIDPKTGCFDYELADMNLLYNLDHPDPSDPLHLFGVDDGFGYREGEKTWYFSSRYRVYI